MNAIRKFDLKAIVACVIVFGIVQGLLFGEIIGPFWELNIILICINIILAVSLNLINGYTGQFSIGHAGFMAVGAYTSAIMTVKLGMPFEAGLVVATLAAGLLGFLIGLPTLRLDGDYLAIATLGLGEIIRICILNIDYRRVARVDRDLHGRDAPRQRPDPFSKLHTQPSYARKFSTKNSPSHDFSPKPEILPPGASKNAGGFVESREIFLFSNPGRYGSIVLGGKCHEK